jgi:hypothetical protein
MKKHSDGKNNSAEGILIVLRDYIDRQRIKKVVQKIKEKPLVFQDGFTAEKVRAQNREN